MARKTPVLDDVALAMIEEVLRNLAESEKQAYTQHQTSYRYYHDSTDKQAQKIHESVMETHRMFMAALLDANKKRSR